MVTEKKRSIGRQAKPSAMAFPGKNDEGYSTSKGGKSKTIRAAISQVGYSSVDTGAGYSACANNH